MVVRNPVRKVMSAAVVGVLGALIAVPMLTAAAQTVPGEGNTPPPPPGNCVILSVTPNPVASFPADVTISGTAPNGVHLTVFAQAQSPANSPVVAAGEQDVTNGLFSQVVHLTQPTFLSANFVFGNKNAYTAGCSTPNGEVSVLVTAAGANRGAQGALAFTGSSNTPSYVLIGVAALVLGAVLVVAARRRSQVS